MWCQLGVTYLFCGVSRWGISVCWLVGCGWLVLWDVVWVVTDLFIASVVVVGAVAGFGAVVLVLFVVVVDGEEGVWEWGVGTMMTDQCSCGMHLIFGVHIFANGIHGHGCLA